MKQVTLYYLYLFLCAVVLLPAVSCTDSTDTPLSADTTEGEGRVILSYAIGNSTVTTRATEAGIEDRYENLVQELDLFIFNDDGYIHQYYEIGENRNNGTYYTLDTDLHPSDIADGDQIYLLANCHDAVKDVTSLEVLQAVTVNGLVCNEKQSSFVMDGNVTVSDTMRNGNDLTIQVDLARAAAKIRLHINGYDTEEDWKQVSYRFCHHATDATAIDLGDMAEYTYTNDLTLKDYPTEDGELETEFSTETENGNQCLVLYAYPNYWYNGTPGEDKLNVSIPIDSDRETRILLRAPYEGTPYYYDIPLNYRLPTNNDEVNIAFENYKDLYRVQRNHIYDITVSIDRAGGPESEPVTLNNLYYSVVAWQEQSIDVPAFE